MCIKRSTRRYSTPLGGLNDTPLSDFIRDKKVLSCRERCFCIDGVPHVCLAPVPLSGANVTIKKAIMKF